MSIENNTAPDTDDLDAFSDLFFGNEKSNSPEPEAKVEDEPAEQSEAEPEVTEEETPEDESQDQDDKPAKPLQKKQTFQERADQLTKLRWEAERRAEEAERLAAEWQRKAEAKTEVKVEPEVKAQPSPSDLNEDGEPKYELGEYDPQYIADLTRFHNERFFEEKRAEEAKKAIESAQQAQARQLETKWIENVQAVKDTLPDYDETIQNLAPIVEQVPVELSNYLQQVIMTLDNGPQVLYYLSQNPEEAKQIIASGHLGATLALGGLNSQFKRPKEQPKPKVSQAPEPPAIRARGSGGKFTTPGDTDDLDAFADMFFRK